MPGWGAPPWLEVADLRQLPGLGGCPLLPLPVFWRRELWTVAGETAAELEHAPTALLGLYSGCCPWPAAFALLATETCSLPWASRRVAWVLDVSFFPSPHRVAGGGPIPRS